MENNKALWLTPECVLVYPSLFEPSSFEKEEPTYSGTFLIPKNADMGAAKEAIHEAFISKFEHINYLLLLLWLEKKKKNERYYLLLFRIALIPIVSTVKTAKERTMGKGLEIPVFVVGGPVTVTVSISV